MLNEIFTNLIRKKIRTILSIGGVVVGVFAFIVIGSLAENFNLLTENFKKNFSNKIYVCKKFTFWSGGGILPESKIDEVNKAANLNNSEGTPSIYAIIPLLIDRIYNEKLNLIGMPEVVIGIPADKLNILYNKSLIKRGALNFDDQDSVIIGNDIAKQNNIGLNQELDLKGHKFIVKGIFKKTGGLEDKQALITMTDAQKLLDMNDLITAIAVIPAQYSRLDEIALKIKMGVSNIQVLTPKDFQAQVKETLSIWNLLILGALMLAASICTLCIVITMLITINERVPEIGLKIAIGASKEQIMIELLLESFIITLSGWIVAAISSFVFIYLFNNHSNSGQLELFYLTPRITLISLLWTLCLGLLGGLYPAWKAANLDPVLSMKR